MTAPAIDCRHLTHRYGGFTAVDDLTLQVAVGETLGLLGPNGAGKTTVVKLLTTLAPIQRGEVRIFGLDARRDTMDIRYNLGYVPQQVSIEPLLTGRENVEWLARLYDVPRRFRAERVTEALAAIGLLDVADDLARTYSGGMVRRLELAQTVLLTTHYMEEADVLCDRVALMDHGVLRAVGAPADLKAEVGPHATLEDVFRRHAGSDLHVG